MNSIAIAFFSVTFFCYLVATFLYLTGLIGNRYAETVADGPAEATPERFARWTRWGYLLLTAGTVFHLLAIVFRGLANHYWPTHNMFEFVTFMAFTGMVAFHILNRMYNVPALGALLAPVGTVLIGYASVFPHDVSPLIPALQSYWLWLHVTTAAAGEGFFAVAFGASILYLWRTHERAGKWDRRAMEWVFYLVAIMIGFELLVLLFDFSSVKWVFDSSVYTLPPIVGEHGFAVGSRPSWLGLPMPLIEGPDWMKGKNMNTLIWSWLVGLAIYWLVRALVRRPLGDVVARWVKRLDPDLLDEISYRSVAIGYPIFTLGGLVFAMIWAKEAWGSYWFWDPKETWAFISWLVYSGYLHLRINKGWLGRPSAWTAVVGFAIILFTLIGVNLLIVGMHSYAG